MGKGKGGKGKRLPDGGKRLRKKKGKEKSLGKKGGVRGTVTRGQRTGKRAKQLGGGRRIGAKGKRG